LSTSNTPGHACSAGSTGLSGDGCAPSCASRKSVPAWAGARRIIDDGPMHSSRARGCSPYRQPMPPRDTPDEETSNWRAVCGRTASTVRRAGRATFPTPITESAVRSLGGLVPERFQSDRHRIEAEQFAADIDVARCKYRPRGAAMAALRPIRTPASKRGTPERPAAPPPVRQRSRGQAVVRGCSTSAFSNRVMLGRVSASARCDSMISTILLPC
jgi:hypothetical protein